MNHSDGRFRLSAITLVPACVVALMAGCQGSRAELPAGAVSLREAGPGMSIAIPAHGELIMDLDTASPRSVLYGDSVHRLGGTVVEEPPRPYVTMTACTWTIAGHATVNIPLGSTMVTATVLVAHASPRIGDGSSQKRVAPGAGGSNGGNDISTSVDNQGGLIGWDVLTAAAAEIDA